MRKLLAPKIVASFGALIVALAAWGFWLEPASLSNENYELTLPAWPRECDGLKIAALADLHVGSPFNDLANLQRVIQATLAAEPDLILLLGDYVSHGVIGGNYIPPDRIAGGLKGLSAPLGVFAVLGNHDHWDGAGPLEKAFRGAGIDFLEDDAVPLVWKNCEFSLIGLSDFLEGTRSYSRVLGKLPENKPAIAFTHNPDVFPLLPASLSLVLAGHTHGGQVSLPLFGPIVLPSRYGTRYAAGHIVEENRHLFVSTGIGTSILPVRFMVPPEVSIVVLRPAP